MTSTLPARATTTKNKATNPLADEDEATVTTQRAAARIAGVSATTIGGWLRRGILGPKPWTPSELIMARALTRPRGVLSPHGTTSRWRVGCDCPRCADAHAEDARQRRNPHNQLLWDRIEAPLLDAFARGTPYRQALDHHGLTAQALSRRRRRDPDFAKAVNAALMAGRDPNLRHGRDSAWKAGCRCPDCTDYHQRTRKPQPPN